MDRTDFDMEFSCPVCLSPSQSIVFGICQHYVCAECLYGDECGKVPGVLRPSFHNCPVCKHRDAFPDIRPDIPESTKKLMAMAGVVMCKRKKCQQEMWSWELKDHERSCTARTPHKTRQSGATSDRVNRHATCPAYSGVMIPERGRGATAPPRSASTSGRRPNRSSNEVIVVEDPGWPAPRNKRRRNTSQPPVS